MISCFQPGRHPRYAVRALLVTLLLPALLLSHPAAANEASAKAAAKDANCKPGKVEAVRTVAGRQAEVVYKVECTGVKEKVTILIRCQDRLCTLLR